MSRPIIGNTTATPNPRPDWNQTEPKKADYIKNKPPINKSRFKGYYYKAIDFDNKQIYLDFEQADPPIKYGSTGNDTISNLKCRYAEWDKIVITDADFHYLCGIIHSVNNNVITLKELLDYDLIKTISPSLVTPSDYVLFVPDKPDVGLVEVSFEGLVIGNNCRAFGDYSFAQGDGTVAIGDYSHAEGASSKALASYSHAEGRNTRTTGQYSHAEGRGSEAKGSCTHAEGYYTVTNEDRDAYGQHVQGRYNIEEGSYKYAHIVGNGTEYERSNAHTLDWDGNAWFAGDVLVGADRDKLATEKRVGEKIDELIDAAPGVLDTLGELAKALNNDKDFAATVTNALALKADKTELETAQNSLKITAEIIDDVLVLKQGV